MSLETQPFVHDYKPGALHFGRGRITDIAEALSDRGAEQAMIVCDHNIAANDALMEPITEALDGHFVGVFDETTPAKSVETALAGAKAMEELEADALIGLGAGSSLDTTKVINVLQAEPRSLEELRSEVDTEGGIALPDDMDALVPMVAVPTTFPGADLSCAAGIAVPMDSGVTENVVLRDGALMPTDLFYDPDCYETTPMNVLAGSAINGFDKAIEAIYSIDSNPVTDATAIRSLRYLRSALPELRSASEPSVMDRAVTGIVLAQYGISSPSGSKINVVHAFGQGLRREFGIQQGVAHAVTVPHVLRLLFNHVDARRTLLAEGLVQNHADDLAEDIIAAVTDVRDGLELPGRLRDVEGVERTRLQSAAERIHENALLEQGPPDFDPSIEAIESTLNAAW